MLNLKSYDFYRNIPKDLTETSNHGAILSLCATIFMITLFVAELWGFMSPDYATHVIIDPNTDSLMRISFNITLLDTPCEFAMIDAIDVLGSRNNNITKNINKWHVDERGVAQSYDGVNKEQRELQHDTHHDLARLQANGIHAVGIEGADSFNHWLEGHEYTFANFYAPWCVWCQRLEPVWEAFAEHVEREQELAVSVVKVDCVANRELCTQQRIQAFPGLRLFKRSEAQMPDYRADRTVEALVNYVHQHISAGELSRTLSDEGKKQHEEDKARAAVVYPGCAMEGFLLVNRVPGNFHLEARSKNHNLNPVMANLSHVVHHLSFGNPLDEHDKRLISSVPNELFSFEKTFPIDNMGYLNKAFHEAFHHYIKVVGTQVSSSSSDTYAYQMVHSAQIMQYMEDDTPEARFAYDISPMSVVISSDGKPLYQFVTSICAVIGGTFTVVGIISGVLSVIFKAKKI